MAKEEGRQCSWRIVCVAFSFGEDKWPTRCADQSLYSIFVWIGHFQCSMRTVSFEYPKYGCANAVLTHVEHFYCHGDCAFPKFVRIRQKSMGVRLESSNCAERPSAASSYSHVSPWYRFGPSNALCLYTQIRCIARASAARPSFCMQRRTNSTCGGSDRNRRVFERYLRMSNRLHLNGGKLEKKNAGKI